MRVWESLNVNYVTLTHFPKRPGAENSFFFHLTWCMALYKILVPNALHGGSKINLKRGLLFVTFLLGTNVKLINQ